METSTNGTARDEGLRLLKAGRVNDAISTLERAVQDNPNDSQTQMYLGIACHQGGEGLRAARHLEESIRLQPSPRACYNLGLVYEASKRENEAVDLYQRALSMEPGYAHAQQALQKLRARIMAPAPVADDPYLNQTQAVPPPASVNQTQVVDPPPAPAAQWGQSMPNGGYAPPPGPQQGVPAGGPPSYIARQIEEQRKIQEAHRTLIVNGIVYGAICGMFIFILMGVAGMFMPMAAFMPGIGLVAMIVNGGLGTIFGALVGFWMGYTAGDEMQAALAGAVLRAVFSVIGGLLTKDAAGDPYTGGQLFGLFLMGGIAGAAGGLIIGKMVDCSIGQI